MAKAVKKSSVKAEKSKESFWLNRNFWPSSDGKLPRPKVQDSDKEVDEFLRGPSNKNPPGWLRELSVKELRKTRKDIFDTIGIPIEKHFHLDWHGTWAHLHKLIEWCQYNHFLHFRTKDDKNKWMRQNFTESNKSIPDVEYDFLIKTIWSGTLGSLIEFFILLIDTGVIDEPDIRNWVANHFRYTVKRKDRGINIFSMRAIWSTIKNSEGAVGPNLTPEQRSSLLKILKEIRPPK